MTSDELSIRRAGVAGGRKALAVELRYFGGLSVEEAAEVLKVSPDTAGRGWRRARAFLLREMERK